MNDKDTKKIILTYGATEDGSLYYDKVYTFLGEDSYIEEAFDNDKHKQEINDFLEKNEVQTFDEAKEKGILAILKNDSPELESELDDKQKFDSILLYKQNTSYVKKPINKKKVATSIVTGALASAAAITGITVLTNHLSQQNIDDDKSNEADQNTTIEELENLINSMDSARAQAFFKDVVSTMQEVNENMSKENNFKLAEDKTDLYFTCEEIIAAKIALNNYTSEELYEIFGNAEQVGQLSLDGQSVYEAFRSSYLKLATYSMNAKEPSGLSSLIEDEASRTFFEKHENLKLTFNQENSTTNSDNLIKALYYDYTDTGLTGNYADLNNDSVALLTSAIHYGHMHTVRNVDEYAKINEVTEAEKTQYGDRAIQQGLALNKVLEGNELLEDVLKNTDLTIVEELNSKSLCAASLKDITEDMDALRSLQNTQKVIITSFAKNQLMEGLKELNENDALQKLISSATVTDAVLDDIAGVSRDANKLVVEYNDFVKSLSIQGDKVQKVVELTNKVYSKNTDIDIISLINDRTMTPPVIEKDVTIPDEIKDVVAGTDDKGTIIFDKDKLEEKSEKEQEEIVKEHGQVVGEETKTTETPVDREDLNKQEQQQIDKQQAILEEIDALQESLQTQAIGDANDYVEEKGAYKYSKDIINPYNNEKIDTNSRSLFQIAAYVSAFGDDEINSKDSQIQSRITKDAEEASGKIDALSNDARDYLKDKYGDNWKAQFLENSYKSKFAAELDRELSLAKQQGPIIKQEAKDAYDRLQAEIVETTTQPEVVKPVVDPMIDPNHSTEGETEVETTYVPPTVDMPFTYVDDTGWETSYESTSKSK